MSMIANQKIFITSDIEGRLDWYLLFLIRIGALDSNKLDQQQQEVLIKCMQLRHVFMLTKGETDTLISIAEHLNDYLSDSFQGKILFNGDFISNRSTFADKKEKSANLFAQPDPVADMAIDLWSHEERSRRSLALAEACYEMFQNLKNKYGENRLILVAGNHDVAEFHNYDNGLQDIKQKILDEFNIKRYYKLKTKKGKTIIFKHAPWATQEQFNEILSDQNPNAPKVLQNDAGLPINDDFCFYNCNFHDNEDRNKTYKAEYYPNMPNNAINADSLCQKNCFLIHGHTHEATSKYKDAQQNCDINQNLAQNEHRICTDYDVHYSDQNGRYPSIDYFELDENSGELQALDLIDENQKHFTYNISTNTLTNNNNYKKVVIQNTTENWPKYTKSLEDKCRDAGLDLNNNTFDIAKYNQIIPKAIYTMALDEMLDKLKSLQDKDLTEKIIKLELYSYICNKSDVFKNNNNIGLSQEIRDIIYPFTAGLDGWKKTIEFDQLEIVDEKIKDINAQLKILNDKQKESQIPPEQKPLEQNINMLNMQLQPPQNIIPEELQSPKKENQPEDFDFLQNEQIQNQNNSHGNDEQKPILNGINKNITQGITTRNTRKQISRNGHTKRDKRNDQDFSFLKNQLMQPQSNSKNFGNNNTNNFQPNGPFRKNSNNPLYNNRIPKINITKGKRIFFTSDLEGRYDLYLRFLIDIGALDTHKLSPEARKLLVETDKSPLHMTDDELATLLNINVASCLNPNFHDKILFNGDFVSGRPMCANYQGQEEIKNCNDAPWNNYLKQRCADIDKKKGPQYRTDMSVKLAEKCYDLFKALQDRFHDNCILVAGNHDIYDYAPNFDLQLKDVKNEILHNLDVRRYYHIKTEDGGHIIFKHAPWANDKQLNEMLTDKNPFLPKANIVEGIFECPRKRNKPDVFGESDDVRDIDDELGFYQNTVPVTEDAEMRTEENKTNMALEKSNMDAKHCFVIHGHTHGIGGIKIHDLMFCCDNDVHRTTASNNHLTYFTLDEFGNYTLKNSKGDYMENIGEKIDKNKYNKFFEKTDLKQFAIAVTPPKDIYTYAFQDRIQYYIAGKLLKLYKKNKENIKQKITNYENQPCSALVDLFRDGCLNSSTAIDATASAICSLFIFSDNEDIVDFTYNLVKCFNKEKTKELFNKNDKLICYEKREEILLMALIINEYYKINEQSQISQDAQKIINTIKNFKVKEKSNRIETIRQQLNTYIDEHLEEMAETLINEMVKIQQQLIANNYQKPSYTDLQEDNQFNDFGDTSNRRDRNFDEFLTPNIDKLGESDEENPKIQEIRQNLNKLQPKRTDREQRSKINSKKKSANDELDQIMNFIPRKTLESQKPPIQEARKKLDNAVNNQITLINNFLKNPSPKEIYSPIGAEKKQNAYNLMITPIGFQQWLGREKSEEKQLKFIENWCKNFPKLTADVRFRPWAVCAMVIYKYYAITGEPVKFPEDFTVFIKDMIRHDLHNIDDTRFRKLYPEYITFCLKEIKNIKKKLSERRKKKTHQNKQLKKNKTEIEIKNSIDLKNGYSLKLIELNEEEEAERKVVLYTPRRQIIELRGISVFENNKSGYTIFAYSGNSDNFNGDDNGPEGKGVLIANLPPKAEIVKKFSNVICPYSIEANFDKIKKIIECTKNKQNGEDIGKIVNLETNGPIPGKHIDDFNLRKYKPEWLTQEKTKQPKETIPPGDDKNKINKKINELDPEIKKEEEKTKKLRKIYEYVNDYLKKLVEKNNHLNNQRIPIYNNRNKNIILNNNTRDNRMANKNSLADVINEARNILNSY